jgi:hypothetical protein
MRNVLKGKECFSAFLMHDYDKENDAMIEHPKLPLSLQQLPSGIPGLDTLAVLTDRAYSGTFLSQSLVQPRRDESLHLKGEVS